MPVTLDAAIEALDAATLTPVVRRATGDAALVPHSWTRRALVGGRAGSTAGIYRVAGPGWSVVLKILNRSGGLDDPNDYRYWRREAHVFESALLDGLPPGLRGPRCFGIEERGDTLWMWLEDAPDTVGLPWPIGRFALAAGHLGRFNGAYLAGRPLPDHPWLARGLLRSYVQRSADDLALLASMEDHRLVRRSWPGEALDRVRRLWEEREHLLAVLAGLPPTLCHGDASDQNLLGDDQETIAIDWAYAGIGVVGEDLAVLLRSRPRDGVGYGYAAFDAALFPTYVAGLREAGWRGDERVVRLGFTATVALRYALNCFPLRAFGDEGAQARLTASFGYATFGQLVDWTAELRAYAFELADEARALAG